jgi:hypothetical protein
MKVRPPFLVIVTDPSASGVTGFPDVASDEFSGSTAGFDSDSGAMAKKLL